MWASELVGSKAAALEQTQLRREPYRATESGERGSSGRRIEGTKESLPRGHRRLDPDARARQRGRQCDCGHDQQHGRAGVRTEAVVIGLVVVMDKASTERN
jgi:hypothetical protein